LPVRPQAIFAANDDMAIGAYSAIREHGLHIPEQIAVTGFDDINIASYLRPKLTTVHLPITELGTTAAEELITAIENKNEDSSNATKIILPTGLVIRESCGCFNHKSFESDFDEGR
jgi:LacI family transcriptional regulator